MKFSARSPAFFGAIATALCLITVAGSAANEAIAQVIVMPGITRSYYSGYGTGYGGYGYNSYGYTGYGYGPYGYGSVSPYGYPSSVPYAYRSSAGYGYRGGAPYSLYYRGLQLQGGTYRSMYNPNNSRFYSPYGYRGY